MEVITRIAGGAKQSNAVHAELSNLGPSDTTRTQESDGREHKSLCAYTKELLKNVQLDADMQQSNGTTPIAS
jgi:hypothetical protein